jgi:hypothetical protein
MHYDQPQLSTTQLDTAGAIPKSYSYRSIPKFLRAVEDQDEEEMITKCVEIISVELQTDTVMPP